MGISKSTFGTALILTTCILSTVIAFLAVSRFIHLFPLQYFYWIFLLTGSISIFISLLNREIPRYRSMFKNLPYTALLILLGVNLFLGYTYYAYSIYNHPFFDVKALQLDIPLILLIIGNAWVLFTFLPDLLVSRKSSRWKSLLIVIILEIGMVAHIVKTTSSCSILPCTATTGAIVSNSSITESTV